MERGSTTVLKGTVLLTLADTVAAHQLGGFKVGVGFALRKCLECMATQSDLDSKVIRWQINPLCNLNFGKNNFNSQILRAMTLIVRCWKDH